MIQSLFNGPISSNILKQAMTDVIKAVTIEETAFANILDFVSDIVQKAKNDSDNLEEFVSLNEFVNSILKNITEVERMIQIKLQYMKELIQTIENRNETDSMEE
jgi:hypothetical protein